MHIGSTLRKRIQRWFQRLEQLLETTQGIWEQEGEKVRVVVPDDSRKEPYSHIQRFYDREL